MERRSSKEGGTTTILGRRELVLLPAILHGGNGTDWLGMAMNRFAKKYNAFAVELAAGKFGLDEAKELSRLWRRVEECGEWPRPRN